VRRARPRNTTTPSRRSVGVACWTIGTRIITRDCTRARCLAEAPSSPLSLSLQGGEGGATDGQPQRIASPLSISFLAAESAGEAVQGVAAEDERRQAFVAVRPILTAIAAMVCAGIWSQGLRRSRCATASASAFGARGPARASTSFCARFRVPADWRVLSRDLALVLSSRSLMS